MVKKFIDRKDKEKLEDPDYDPLSATEKTLTFSRKQPHHNQSEFESIIQDDSKSNQISNPSTVSEKPESNQILKEDQQHESKANFIHQQKLSSIHSNIEREKKEYKKIANQVSVKSKSVAEARANLQKTQEEIHYLIQEQFKDNEILNKFSIVGEASAKMAHDIRNPLNVIKYQVELIRLEYAKQDDEIMLNSLERMERSIQSISNQLNDVLSFLKAAPSSFTKNSLLDLLRGACEELMIPKDVEVILPENDYPVMCDPSKTKNVFSNIILNGIQALENKGKIMIKINEHYNHYMVDIEDSGPGIPVENLESIFEPLFTTKSEGTGLGLSTCKQIIEKQGWEISVRNNPTTFTVSIPVESENSKHSNS